MTDLNRSTLESEVKEDDRESNAEESEIEEEGSADQNGELSEEGEEDEDQTGSNQEEEEAKDDDEENEENQDQQENQSGKDQEGEEDQRQPNISEKEETAAKDEEEAENNGKTEGDQENSLKQGQRWELVWVREQNIWDFHLDIYIRKWVCVKTKDAAGLERINPPHNRFTFPKPEDKKSVTSKMESTSKQQLISSETSVAALTGQRSSIKSKGVEKPSSSGGNQPKKEYICKQPNCEKIFPDHQTLKKHMLAHGDKQHICQVEGCGKRFVDNSKLRRHQLVHTGERPYSCEICGKTFSLDFNLKTHLRTHTGEKPYACKFAGCDKRFTQSSNLTAHEKCHSFKEEP